jgi:ubiquinone/menaquinone biosynthesis C-methylase UbiE
MGNIMVPAQAFDDSVIESSNELANVYSDADMHLSIANTVRNHLVNGQDIREIAFHNLTLSKKKNIIDLGCGFGFFTEGLKGKVHRNAKVAGVDRHSRNRQLYINVCKDSGLKGTFFSDGISKINSFENNTFDLAICSYALYFFPNYIEQIANIIKEDGIFVVITHSQPHMKEFTLYVKNIFNEKGFDVPERLPYEELIDNFSNENGKELLSQWFNNVESKKVKSSLLFKYNDYLDFEKYVRFKCSFFIPGKECKHELLTGILLESVKNEMKKKGEVKISKEDIIFICSDPIIKVT